jgi:hypothetical protein
LNKEEILRQPLYGNEKLCNQQGFPWDIQLKSRLCLWVTKGIQHLEEFWNEKEDAWQTTNHFKNITCSKNTTKNKATIIGSLPWNLSKPNVHFKPLIRQWKVLALPQADFQTQEFYHVHSEINGMLMAMMYKRVGNTKLFKNVPQMLIEILNYMI